MGNAQARRSREGAMRMTEGSIPKQILKFAAPLLLGNLFQQLYNTADALIVGNFLGSNGLAAISASEIVVFLMIGFFQGLFIGAGVVVSRYFGAEDTEGTQRAVHTSVALGLVSGVFLTILGVGISPHLMRWMGTPAEVYHDSVLYYQVYFCGSLAFVMYNCRVGILQSVGDSRHPLIYLIISSILNIVLDLFLVAVLGMGIGAAAFATIVSQALSSILCLRRLLKSTEEYRLVPSQIRFDREMLGQILKNGVPSGLHYSIISIGNVVVQANINAFGKLAMAGCSAYNKLEAYVFLPINCFSMALPTFVSQNIGAKKMDRVFKGAIFGTITCVAIAETVGIILYVFAPWLIAAFNRDPEVIAFGVERTRYVVLFYFLLALSYSAAGVLRGAGKAIVPMMVMLCIWCVFRVTYITIAVHFIPKIVMIYTAYPLTWLMSTIFYAFYLKFVKWLPVET